MRRSLLVLPLLLTACLSSAPAVAVRYFEPPALERAGATEAVAGVYLQSTVVAVGSNVREALTWRLSAVEVTFDETAYWASPPEQLVQARLSAWLGTAERLVPVGTHETPRLGLSLERFEGELDGAPLAHVAFTATLAYRRGSEPVDLRRRFDVRAALPERTNAGLAHGMGAALDEAFAELDAWLRATLEG